MWLPQQNNNQTPAIFQPEKITGKTDLSKTHAVTVFCDLVVISISLHCQLLRLHVSNNVDVKKQCQPS
jgi:hypothetical protein